jgi:hypothetical protein
VGARFSAPFQIGPGAHPASYTMGTGVSFPGVKWPGRGVDHPPSSSGRVKERVQLYLYSPSGNYDIQQTNKNINGNLNKTFNLAIHEMHFHLPDCCHLAHHQLITSINFTSSMLLKLHKNALCEVHNKVTGQKSSKIKKCRRWQQSTSPNVSSP